MRRLLQLEKSNGIWSQKMQMRLSQSWVLIMDYETGAVMERFPVELIQEPTAFTSHDPLEIYNNILVFIVGEERPVESHSEMHIFQCQSVPAQELVEDLKLLRAGKLPMMRRERRIPPPPSTPPPDPPINVREQVSIFNSGAHHGDAVGRGGSRTETSSTSSERYERDVTILNHCFDDIEKFIARLQHAAAASRELERRRRNRKSKKKDLGDGMLTMRAKPPPEVEFVDVFQKFKLSFNLLAKLKAHIHDPNAPELVHFLFTPLALIVDASHDTHYGPNLPAKVVSPLLTREAVNLLINCVTSKETELWHSLGDAWLISRDQWKGFVTPYHPVFMDGWSPEYPVIDEHEAGAGNAENKRNRGENHSSTTPVDPELREYMRGHEDSHFNNDFIDYEGQKTPAEPGRYEFESRNFHENFNERARSHSREARSDISVDSIERTGQAENQARFERTQAAWLEDLIDRNAKIVRVTYPRTANNDKELTVIRGEYLEILDDSRKWWKGRNARGQIGHVPHTIVSSYAPGDVEDVFSNPLYSQGFDRERHFGGRPQDEVDARKSGSESPLRSPPMPPPAPADWVRKERLGKKGEFRYF
ncbi:UNVERIFIED_CONTAM: hypothetical protein PYX00_008583 [Menopon gallinae]|uniref:SH3 domain-containing protein n=1 Tax=Menopon gallinae TaxID=328185 RepID=A0AAW2HPZ0_9NEOP